MTNSRFRLKIVVVGMAAVLAALVSITPSQADPGPGQPPGSPTPVPSGFPTSPVIVVVAHPDDETLGLGVPLAEHANQPVYVFILTSGGARGAIHLVNNKLADEQPSLTPLTTDAFMASREAEAVAAVAALSATAQVHFGRLGDGTLTAPTAKAARLAKVNEITSGAVRLKGHSYISAVEPHSDHLA